MNWLDSVSINLLSKDLDGLWTRQQAISDNIANVDTPGYKSKVVSFEQQLRSVLESSDSQRETTRRIKDTRASVSVSDALTLRADGNNVDVESENTELARTQINYLYSLRELSDHFTRLRYAINGSNG